MDEAKEIEEEMKNVSALQHTPPPKDEDIPPGIRTDITFEKNPYQKFVRQKVKYIYKKIYKNFICGFRP